MSITENPSTKDLHTNLLNGEVNAHYLQNQKNPGYSNDFGNSREQQIKYGIIDREIDKNINAKISGNSKEETKKSNNSIRSAVLPQINIPPNIQQNAQSNNLPNSNNQLLLQQSPNNRNVTFHNISNSVNVASLIPRSVSVSQFHASNNIFSPPPAKSQKKTNQSNSRGQNPLTPPEPVFFDDPVNGRYGIRCICKKCVAEGFLIQCDSCGYWLHGHCVCMAKPTRESYICPFCYTRVIRCSCNQNTRYDIPIVQCKRCKFYVHKTCEDLNFGIVPHNFICKKCGGKEFALPQIILKSDMIPNKTSFIECDRFEVLQSIPDGHFRDLVLQDLSKSELFLPEVIGRYFQEFATIFFDDNHEFWRTFLDTFTTILGCDKSVIMQAIDSYAYSLLYKSIGRPYYSNLPTKFGISDSVAIQIDSMNLKRFEKPPKQVSLYLDHDGHVKTSQTLDDEQFIIDLPGYLMYNDELNADDGIPPTCLAVTDTEFVVDMEGSSFTFAHSFQRSFHFNTIVKMYRLGDDPRVGLFATRLKGPVSEEKGKRGPAIQHDTPLILPFDGEIPFNTPKVEWKERKVKSRHQSKNQSINSSKAKGTQNAKRRGSRVVTPSVPLSLLSAFCEDIIPPIPITLLTEKEAAEKRKQEEMPKTRSRNHRIHNYSDD